MLTAMELTEFTGKTPQEVIAELSRRQKEKINEDRLPKKLTEAERKLARTSLAALDRQWRIRAGWEIKTTDFQEIGQLNDAQLELPRTLILQLIRSRRRDNFIERMNTEGREVLRCTNYSQLYPADRDHNCFTAAGWARPAKKDGIPATREMLVTQTGKGGIRIRQQVGVDADKLNDNYEE